MADLLLHSIIISQFLGLYLIILTIIMVSRANFYRTFFMKMRADSGALIVAAACALFFGLFVICVHNFWNWSPALIVTVVAWLIVIKSILWLSFPEKMVSCTHDFFSGYGYYLTFGIIGLIGVLLLFRGFYMFRGPTFFHPLIF